MIIFVELTDPNANAYRQESIILVPMDTRGGRRVEPLTEFGYDHAPHGHMEMEFEDMRVPADNTLQGEDRGLEIAHG